MRGNRPPLSQPVEIASEISASADFLSTDLRNVDARQCSIRGIFNYSWDLLGPCEREVFQALSVCRGGFTREAAQAVAEASLRDLLALTSKSLVYRRPEGRYEMHELLRQYAAEKLSGSPERERAARQRHCAWGLYGAAQLLAAEGEEQQALELNALVKAQPMTHQLLKDLAASSIADLEKRLAPALVAEATALGRARDLDATVTELIEELEAEQ